MKFLLNGVGHGNWSLTPYLPTQWVSDRHGPGDDIIVSILEHTARGSAVCLNTVAHEHDISTQVNTVTNTLPYPEFGEAATATTISFTVKLHHPTLQELEGLVTMLAFEGHSCANSQAALKEFETNAQIQ
jgi:hypothetical protein